MMALNPTESEEQLRRESGSDFAFQQQEPDDPGRITEIAAAGDTGGVQIGLTPPKESPTPDEQAAVAEASEAAARRFQRKDIRPTIIKSDEDYSALEPGREFIDPKGQRRRKPYEVRKEFADSDYEAVPEGAQFLDPEGDLRTKPKFLPLDVTTQTLFNMSANDKERRNALVRAYGKEAVKKDEKGFYIEEESGILRRPKGMLEETSALAAGIAGGAFPTAGAIGGELAGAAVGTAAAPGVGTIAGGIAGAGAGGAFGQMFNDVILQLTGVYDRSPGEQIVETGLAAGFGAVGAGAGAALRSVKEPVKNLWDAYGGRFVGWALGVDPAGLETAVRLRKEGMRIVPPSMSFKEAPHWINIAEVLDPAFRTQRPIEQEVRRRYEQEAAKQLKNLGVADIGSLLEPEAAVPVRKAGQSLQMRALEEASEADLQLSRQIEEARTRATAGVQTAKEDLARLQKSAEESHAAAHKVIAAGYRDIEQDIERAFTVAQSGSNSGDLWWSAGEKLKTLRAAMMDKFRRYYMQGDNATINAVTGLQILPDSTELGPIADAFLARLPERFEKNYPAIVKQMRDLAGVQNPNGTWAVAPVNPTYGQLHNLRSELRYNVDWYDMPHDIRDGVFKYMQRAVDDVLHDPKAPMELQMASRLLDATDKAYAEEMPIWNAKSIRAVIRGLEPGEAADPIKLFQTIAKEGQTDLTNKVMEMVGPQIRAGVRAADTKSMLDASLTLESMPGQPEYDGQKFAREVLERYRTGMLQTIHRDNADKIYRQAQLVGAYKGKVDVNPRPGDTAFDIVRQARVNGELAKEAAKKDPLKVLEQESKKLEADLERGLNKLQSQRLNTQLGYLYNPRVGAIEAAERTLASQDNILAVAARFGTDSTAWKFLQQSAILRIFQDTLNPGERAARLQPEVLNLLFPGGSREAVQTFFKEMEMLTATKGMRLETGRSIMAQAAVEHPFGRLVGKGGEFLPKMPGGDYVARMLLGKYYKFITEDIINNIPFMEWVLRGIKGDAQAQAMARDALMQRWERRFGEPIRQRRRAIGAGIGEAIFQEAPTPTPEAVE